MSKKNNPRRLQEWREAGRRFHLSHAHMQMARELGMNPKKLGKLDNHDQEPWKLPLSEFIEELYVKRFGKRRPEVVMTIEERARLQEKKAAPPCSEHGGSSALDLGSQRALPGAPGSVSRPSAQA